MAVILENEIISCVHFNLGSAILRLSGIQVFAPVHNWSQAPFAWRTLPLMQKARECNSTGIGVQHKFALRIWLRQCSCLNQNQLNGVESQLLLIPPDKGRTQTGNSLQGGQMFGMPRKKLAIIIGEAQKALQLCLVPGYFPIAQLRHCLGSGLIPLAESTRPRYVISDFIKSHLATLILKRASRRHSNTSRKRIMWSSIVSVAMTMSSMYAITMLPSRFTFFQSARSMTR